MLEIVRVADFGPLSPTVLHGLGRVNVICGKNNSGKSTLLSALDSSEHRAVGGSLSREDAEKIAISSADTTAFRHGTGHDFERSIYTEAVTKFLLSRPLWFTSDRDEIVSALSQWAEQNSHLQRFQLNMAFVAQAVLQRLGTFPHTVLVPPKRSLQLSRQISLSEKVEPNGDGLLNFLFYAKNRPAGTPDRQAYDRMSSAFSQISSGFSFGVFGDKNGNSVTLNFARGGESMVPAVSCGLGLQDLLILLYFILVDQQPLLLIEEPESHMHPDMQRRLLTFVRDETDKQLFVTTHSNVFLNNALVDRVFFTTFGSKIVVDDATSTASILDDLGYAVTDNLVSDLVVLVEGPSDVPVLEELFRKLGLLSRFEVKMWPLGGDVMDQLDLSVFAEKYKLIAIIDQDPESASVRKRFEKKCKENSIPVHRLRRYSIENYFTVSALRSVFGNQIPATFATVDENVKLSKQIGFDVKKRNRAVAREMSLKDIEGTDLAKFCDRVRTMLGP
ncbi:MAG: AAA family ATPase [Acidobacteria bacterium]|nr:AAA family ATPase [Acidobacteriota bacterium]MBV9186320.1 AAA family ATPase [Acidobacteriota bacterium]